MIENPEEKVALVIELFGGKILYLTHPTYTKEILEDLIKIPAFKSQFDSGDYRNAWIEEYE